MFRFTIRDVLWLTVVVAMGVGWWVERRQKQDTAAQMEKLRTENGQMRELIGEQYESAARTHWGWMVVPKQNQKASPDKN